MSVALWFDSRPLDRMPFALFAPAVQSTSTGNINRTAQGWLIPRSFQFTVYNHDVIMCPEVYIVLPEVWPQDELLSNQSSILERVFTLSRSVLGCTESFSTGHRLVFFPDKIRLFLLIYCRFVEFLEICV